MGRSRLNEPLPWYQWNPTQWQASRKVARMTWAARGIYRELMDECWIKGRVPSTAEGIADMLDADPEEVAELLPQFIRCFDVQDDGTMTSPFIEAIRTESDARRVAQAAKRLGKDRHGNPKPAITEPNHSEQQLTDVNRSEVEEKRREEYSTAPPTPPSGGPRRRRNRDEILAEADVTREAIQAGKDMLAMWPKADPDGRPITPDLTQTIIRLDELAKRPAGTLQPDLLVAAAREYLKTPRQRYKAPQYFLSLEPEASTGKPPWYEFARGILAQRKAATTPAPQPLPMESPA